MDKIQNEHENEMFKRGSRAGYWHGRARVQEVVCKNLMGRDTDPKDIAEILGLSEDFVLTLIQRVLEKK